MIIGSQAGVVEARAGELLQKRRKLDLSVPPNDPFVRRLSMYPLPPIGPVGTDEFEELAVKRLQSAPKMLFSPFLLFFQLCSRLTPMLY